MQQLVCPTAIPWETLRGAALEELVYWLLEAMGAKDLTWRLGGKGGGAPDGGRDLEAHFYATSPDGGPQRELWWVDAKGRSGTVEPTAVKECVVNAQGNKKLDCLVIATNTVFSNPTRDWVQTWQKDMPRPSVQLWDRSTLERLCSEHPEVVGRLFADALTLQGKLAFLTSRLWNYTWYADAPTLTELWLHRRDLDWPPNAVLAVLVSEVANGDPARHPWVTLSTDLLSFLLYAVANTLSFCLRAERAGVRQSHYIDGVANIFLACLAAHEPATILQVLDEHWRVGEELAPASVREAVLTPVLERLMLELRDVCASDCQRVSSPDLFTFEERERYWDRLNPDPHPGSYDGISVLIQQFRKPCTIGLSLDEQTACPLTLEADITNLAATLRSFREVIAARHTKPRTDKHPVPASSLTSLILLLFACIFFATPLFEASRDRFYSG